MPTRTEVAAAEVERLRAGLATLRAQFAAEAELPGCDCSPYCKGFDDGYNSAARGLVRELDALLGGEAG